MARKQISKKIRFEVFKRDSFKCQYCGAEPPNVILHVDHIHPVSKDGDNDLLNLITSCQPCNLGKGATPLSDQSALHKQKEMLNELNKKREQLEMLLKWKSELKNLNDYALSACEEHWNKSVGGYHLNEVGLKKLLGHLKKYGISELMDAIDLSTDKYLVKDESGQYAKQSVEMAFSKVGAILNINSKPDYEKKLLYCRGIARNRFSYCNDSQALILLKEAFNGMVENNPDEPHESILEAIKDVSLAARNWADFKQLLQDLYQE